MAAVGEVAVGDRGERHGGEPLRGRAGGDRGAQRALGAGAMAHAHPVVEPARERIERDVSAKRLGVGARRLALAVVGDRGDAVEQREEAVLLVEHRYEVGDGHERGEPDSPAIAMGGAIEQGVTHEISGRHARRGRAQHRLADHQADIVGKAVVQAAPPMRGVVAQRRRGRHPHLAADDAHGAQRHVVGPEIEGRAATQIETGMVPVAGEDAVLDAAAMERKAHVRAAVVERDHAVAVGHDEHRTAGRADHHAAAVA